MKRIPNEYLLLAEIKAASGAEPSTAYCVETRTLYNYMAVSGGIVANDQDVLITGDGGDTRWVGIAGQYQYYAVSVDGVSITGDGTPGSPLYTPALMSDKVSMSYNKWTSSIVQQSGADLKWVHGSVIVDDYLNPGKQVIYGAMNLNANTYIVRYNDLDNLADVTVLTLTGYKNIMQMVAPGDGYLYAAPLKGTLDGAASNILILKINEDMSGFSVFVDDGTAKTQRPPSMCTDGTYLYVATVRATPTASQVVKIKISDASIPVITTWTGNSDCHAMTCYKYSDRTEIYTAGTYKNPPQMGKFTTLDATPTVLTLNGSVNIFANNDITDDMAYFNIDDNGGYAYIASESHYLHTRVNTQTMVAESFWGQPSYGFWNYNNDLYSTSIAGEIVKYPNMDINMPEIYETTLTLPNELFIDSYTGKLFVTEYGDNKKLTELLLDKSADFITDNAAYSFKAGYENILKLPFSSAIGRKNTVTGYMSQAFGWGTTETQDYTSNFWDTLWSMTTIIPIWENQYLPVADGAITRVCYKNMTSGNLTISPQSWNRINGGSLGAGVTIASGAIIEFNKSSTTNWNSTAEASLTHIIKGVGVNTRTPKSNFEIQGSLGLKMLSKTAGYSVTPTDAVLEITTAGIVNLLSAASSLGRFLYVKNSSSGAVTLTAVAGDTINKVSQTLNINPKEDVVLISDGVLNWMMFGGVTNKYIKTFDSTTDWGVAAGGYYTITVSQSSHGKGLYPEIYIQELDGGYYKNVIVDAWVDSSNLDVLIKVTETPDGRFEGRLTIK